MTAGRYFEIDLSTDEAISLLATVSQAVNELCITRRAPGQKSRKEAKDTVDRGNTTILLGN